MKNTKTYKSESIKLRAMEPEDLDILYLIENDFEIWNVGNTNVPYSRYVLHDYVANSSGDIYTDKQVRLIIEDYLGETIGMIDLVNFNPKHRRAEISIIIKKDKRGRGYAKEAIEQIKKYSLDILHLHQIYAIVEEENSISRTLFEKMGFTTSIILKDWLYDGHKYSNSMLMQFFL